jgi:hemoglobin-like flavoprotein
MHPEALPIFSFGKDTVLDEEFFKSPHFRAHARFWMQTFSNAIDMLGPDLEVMYETLTYLGEKHQRYGITEEQYSFMGVALIDAVQELLGDEFTSKHKSAWEECWNVMIHTMQHGKEEGISCRRI